VPVPPLRVRAANDRPIRADGDIVLYWMTAFRRTRWNFALDHAIAHARELGKPLVVLEALRSGYRWASDRLHRFVLDGMRDNAVRFAGGPVRHYPYVEPSWTDGQGLLAALARDACVVVGDDYPAFMLPRMVTAAASQVPVRLELVDANGLLPLRAAPQVYATAHALRRFLQRALPEHLMAMPDADPLAELRLPRAPALPDALRRRWPEAAPEVLAATPPVLGALPIDHSVGPVPFAGGERAGRGRLREFLDRQISRYGDDRNEPQADATSRLSPYLHFGHVSVHEVFTELARRERWSPARLAPKGTGARSGWWRMSASAEAFLDQIVTWRELGFNLCWQRTDYDRYDSLPDWARRTLAAHARDRREHVYTLEQFEAAATHDPLWNAAQRQLVREGRIHNYLRMLWGKKILQWTPGPEAALAVMLELNDKYAVDGRDPNSCSGIFWVLGRYDRAWGPERPVFGTVRYMSSENTARKVRVKEYVKAWS
jgi:deoxyribodipyrimidine photo-lyase